LHFPGGTLAGMRFLLLCVAAVPAFAASFDCRKAAAPVEKTICASPRLSALDEELAAAYAAARRSNPSVRDEQKTWIADDRGACAADDAECLEASYLTRIAALRLAGRALFAKQKVPPHVAGEYAEATEVCFIDEKAEEGHTCEEAEHGITIRRGAGNALVVGGDLIFYNGHTCTIEDAPAEWVGGELRVALLDEAGPACVLILRADVGKITLSDAYGRCRSAFCGARGGFDGFELPKKK
jgi:uncharacterized protein